MRESLHEHRDRGYSTTNTGDPPSVTYQNLRRSRSCHRVLMVFTGLAASMSRTDDDIGHVQFRWTRPSSITGPPQALDCTRTPYATRERDNLSISNGRDPCSNHSAVPHGMTGCVIARERLDESERHEPKFSDRSLPPTRSAGPVTSFPPL